MKYIKFKDYDGGFRTKAIVHVVMNTNPRGMTLDEIRRRCKILDLIEESDGHLVVKDEDFGLIKTALETYPFTVAHKGLLQLIDDVLASDEPLAVLMPNGKERGAQENVEV